MNNEENEFITLKEFMQLLINHVIWKKNKSENVYGKKEKTLKNFQKYKFTKNITLKTRRSSRSSLLSKNVFCDINRMNSSSSIVPLPLIRIFTFFLAKLIKIFCLSKTFTNFKFKILEFTGKGLHILLTFDDGNDLAN